MPIARHPIGRAAGLVVHRTRVRTRVLRAVGLPTVEPAIAVVRSWPLTPGVDQRAPAIEAVRNRLVTADELAAVATAASGLPGRSALLRLTARLAAGCESALEIWGHLSVFNVAGLDHGVRQRIVHVAGVTYRLDLAYEDELLAVELDGERYHSSRAQRERDRRRDVALATAGWLTLRFSHERLHRDVRGCRRDTLAALAARRRRQAG